MMRFPALPFSRMSIWRGKSGKSREKLWKIQFSECSIEKEKRKFTLFIAFLIFRGNFFDAFTSIWTEILMVLWKLNASFVELKSFEGKESEERRKAHVQM